MNDGEANGKAQGATEALSVLQERNRVRRPFLGDYVMALLAGHVNGEAWNAAGLPGLRPEAHPVRISDEAVIHLARLAISIYCGGLCLSDRLATWSRLESFFARQLAPSAPQFIRLREVVAQQRQEVGCAPPDVEGLREILELEREAHGDDSYLAGLARANLADAYRQSGDFALAAGLLSDEAAARESRYGRDHPITLVALSMTTRLLLHQADATDDTVVRHELARRALSLVIDVRAARDRLYGITAPNATISRRYEAHALLLLGELDQAQVCLEHTLTFVKARDGRNDGYASGRTHLLLARVHAAAGNRNQALEHAERTQQILSTHRGLGIESWETAALARDIAALADGNGHG
jgi:tetratricopeptide (TPR) repeat protein